MTRAVSKQGGASGIIMTQTWKSKCHSPTLSQTSRSIILQLIVSFKWLLSLGDIKGAFLEADVTKQTQEKPVFAEFPPGGVPGIPRGSLVQVLGNIYGSNDVLTIGMWSLIKLPNKQVSPNPNWTAVCTSAMVNQGTCRVSSMHTWMTPLPGDVVSFQKVA